MIDEKKSGREDLHRLSLLDATLPSVASGIKQITF